MTTDTHMYWQIYQKIEEEVLDLATCIHFSDDNIEVYSIKIADLINRCGVEIESIAKKIYREKTNTDKVDAGVAFAWLKNNWELEKRRTEIYSPYFHFSSKFMFIEPFNYKNKDENDYYSNYCAVKHDREENLNKANVKMLIRTLSALYILNLYIKEDKIILGSDKYGETFDKSRGSEIFNICIFPCQSISQLTSQKDIDKSNCVYNIERNDSTYEIKFKYLNYNDDLESTRLIIPNKQFQDYVKTNIGKEIEYEDLVSKLSQISNSSKESISTSIYNTQKIKEMRSIVAQKTKASYSAYLLY